MHSTTEHRLANLVIIGAMKCGTSSLHRYLSCHPQIAMAPAKELDFFVKEKNWQRGVTWYRSQFADAPIRGEASPNYTRYPIFQGVPERMHQLIPDAKLIYLVRDPVRRILSHYLHNYLDRTENQSLTGALNDLPSNHYVNCSRYYWQLEQFLPYYSLDRLLIVSLEEWSTDRHTTLQRIFQFLEVDWVGDHPVFNGAVPRLPQKNRLTDMGNWVAKLPTSRRFCQWLPGLTERSGELSMDESLEQRLIEILQPDVERLRSLTGRSFARWSV
ncbi:MAG: sulfotransferase domain-containing protein [Leptolyngbyaceae cyanobacterium SL_7_1]|nr:sulfotransferase domain-containing protein [Leptolyngbyaceae cyanobacterium SL_7_1]